MKPPDPAILELWLPCADFVRIRANHNSKIAGGVSAGKRRRR
jgi:hypothetical protein